MNQMIDLVLCEHINIFPSGKSRKFLFQAPAFSWLEKGDKVLVDTQYGESDAEVLRVCTVREGTDQYDMIVACAGATEPIRKVIGKTVLTKFDYKEGETKDE